MMIGLLAEDVFRGVSIASQESQVNQTDINFTALFIGDFFDSLLYYAS
jgi:hypothetical protein